MKTSSPSRFLPNITLSGACLLFCLLSPQAFADDPTPFPSDPAETNAPDSKLPKLLQRIEPVYPAEARGETQERRIFVSFIVDKTGRTTKVSAMFTPPAAFAKAAVESVEQWVFEPGIHHGRPTNTQMTVTLHFTPPQAARAN